MPTIDLNADLGEGGQHDAELMAWITSCNIACGGHAGDLATMQAAVEAALSKNVAIGAHPGYADQQNFGRIPLDLTTNEVRDLIHVQVGSLLEIHPEIHHVKPHGALYNSANKDPMLAAAIVGAIIELLPGTMLYAPAQGELAKAASEQGLKHLSEGFIDRRYLRDGGLAPRGEKGAIIKHANEAAAQALSIALDGLVITRGHRRIPLHAQTLCVHGDSPSAIHLLRRTRHVLESNGFEVKAF